MASSGAHETQTLRSDASYGGLAQLGERLHGMQEVTGSIPVFSTKKALYFVGSMVLFLFAEAGFWGLHCFACTVFRLLQAVPIQPPTFDFTSFSKRNVCRPVFQQAAASFAFFTENTSFAGNHQMPRNVKVNSTGLVTSGIYSGWTLAPQLSSPPTPICSPMARITV